MPSLRSALGLQPDVSIIGDNVIPLTYSTSITPNISAGNIFTIVISDGVAFAINAPTGSIQKGSVIYFDILNSSGGAHGTITWNAIYKMAALGAIASTKRKTVQFYYDGTSWVALGAPSADTA